LGVTNEFSLFQWEFQEPKMEVLYHIRPYELWGYSLTYASKIGLIYGIGTSNQSVPEMAIDSFENGVPKNDEP
jgi:hypothetical protein